MARALIGLWLLLCAGISTAQPIRHAMAQQQSSQVITYELEVLQLLLD